MSKSQGVEYRNAMPTVETQCIASLQIQRNPRNQKMLDIKTEKN